LLEMLKGLGDKKKRVVQCRDVTKSKRTTLLMHMLDM